MRAVPAVGEVTAAIMLTATFAVAAALLYGAFQERTDAVQAAADHRTAASISQASELLAAGPIQCGAGFLLHNYSGGPVRPDDITIYSNGTAGVAEASVSYLDLDGNSLDILEGGRSAWVATGGSLPCGTEIILVTPSGRMIHLSV